ncbi:60S acidic ribosomal protein P1-like [Dromiciops gliroides]|uniref:60S acidic ribosomal protein P1-like n=1 Tax=Dromiciops gliroides TaxID=33562 RepID=UPI001CC5BE01|nr:60S acidic ribosomal protein P1-like [Dromiciops gliroides]
MAVSELTCIYSALILHNDEVTVTEDNINALIKAAGVNVEFILAELFSKALNNVNIASLILANVGMGTCPSSWGAALLEVLLLLAQLPAEEKEEEAKKGESDGVCLMTSSFVSV